MENKISVRAALQKFQDGYTPRDVSKLDEFMQLFVQDDSIEMISVGASKRAANEWFEGLSRIREIVENDWMYWGDVRFDVEGAKITVQGEAAWLQGYLTQSWSRVVLPYHTLVHASGLMILF